MFNNSKKFISVCSVISFLIAGLVTAGFADTGWEDGRSDGGIRKVRKYPRPTPAPAPAPAPVKTWSLYNANCTGCHGLSKQGKSASTIQSAISNNTGGMSFISLTAAQITLLAAGL